VTDVEGAHDGPLDGLSRGTNQTGVRLYNERLVLSIIRRHGVLPKADIARATGLSPQTISIIINQLTADGLLQRGEPNRGRIGQPSVPFSLNPDGAYALGLKIGRRSADLYLINFTGEILRRVHETYTYPTPAGILDFADKAMQKLLTGLPETITTRIAGLGIAAPFEIWRWPEETGAPPADVDAWRTADIRAALAKRYPWPVYFSNDVTAACAAELLFGQGVSYPDYLYLYIGSFIGGGLVLNGHLFPGTRQNAGAIGSMPALAQTETGPRAAQLVNIASIYVLERLLIAQGDDPKILWQSPENWGALGPALDTWITDMSEALALAIVSAAAVLDIPTVMIDGAFPEPVRARIVATTIAAVDRINQAGISPFAIIAGTIGPAARALGGATIPLLANFTQDREVLFKENSTGLR